MYTIINDFLDFVKQKISVFRNADIKKAEKTILKMKKMDTAIDKPRALRYDECNMLHVNIKYLYTMDMGHAHGTARRKEGMCNDDINRYVESGV